MKASLTEAVTRLGEVGEEPSLRQSLEVQARKSDSDTAEIFKLLLGLKTDFTQIRLVSHSTRRLTSIAATIP